MWCWLAEQTLERESLIARAARMHFIERSESKKRERRFATQDEAIRRMFLVLGIFIVVKIAVLTSYRRPCARSIHKKAWPLRR